MDHVLLVARRGCLLGEVRVNEAPAAGLPLEQGPEAGEGSVVEKVIAFVDGENLTLRYQEMVKAGCVPRDKVLHIRDSFVWIDTITLRSEMDLRRVHYFTSVTGDTDLVDSVTAEIAGTSFFCRAEGSHDSGLLIPNVHKKQNKTRKTKVVDVDITIAVMRSLATPIDAIWLMSGDGDYARLVQEITRTTKRVYLAAFSSGLSKELKYGVDGFVDLDELFFASKADIPSSLEPEYA